MVGPKSEQSLRNRMRESAKLAVHGGLQRFDLSLARGSFADQVSRTISSRSIIDVLDIGANVGQYGVGLRRTGYTGRIISCEPLSGAHAQLSRRASRAGTWEVLNTAVGAAPGSVTINVSGNSYSSSIRDLAQAHLDGAPDSAYIAVEEVELTTVAALVERFSVDPARALLKVDTQGFESEVLDGAGDLVGAFDAIQLELSFVELYSGQQLAEDLINRLRSAGYRLQTFAPGMTDNHGRMLQCDLLVVRA